jgi:signal transduction histidine kinase
MVEPASERRQLESLLDVSRELSATLHLETVLERTVRAARTVLRAEGASILLLREETGRLHFEHVDVADHLSHLVPALKCITLAVGEGLAGHTVAHNEPLIIEDTRTDPRWASRVDASTGYLTRDLMVVPLAADGKVIGALEIVNKTDGRYGKADLPLCMAFANMAAAALNNAQLHHKLGKAHERLKELESTRSQYVSTVSHELRTPITVIKGYVQVLEQFRTRLPDARQGEFLRNIDRESDHLGCLLDDLFVVNEIKELPRQCCFMSIDLIDTLRRFVDHWAQVNPERTYRFQHQQGAMILIVADQKKITHCVYHLLDNATKFSSPGSMVEVSVTGHDGGADVVVIDQGIGMTGEVQRRMCEPFWQGEAGDTRSYGGLGLGLYIVYEIAKVHGGSLQCESQPAKGSKFTFRLPSAPPTPAA